MNTSDRHGVDDELGARISAYLDGELPADERLAVERRLMEDPAAECFARDLSGLRELCAEAPRAAGPDLTEAVMAEATRREAAGEGRVEVADRLEPEGEFGLPFGRSSRSWAWAGVAAAAALMISFYGRPDAPPATREGVAGRGGVAASAVTQATLPVGLREALPQMRRALPQLRVVSVETTPEGRSDLERRLAAHGIAIGQPAAASPELAALRQAGVPVEAAPGGGGDQLLLVSAERPQVSNLLRDLEQEKGVFRVEADRPAQSVAAAAPEAQPPAASQQPPAAGGKSIAVRITFRKSPSATNAAGAPQAVAVRSAGRAPVLLWIRTKPTPQP